MNWTWLIVLVLSTASDCDEEPRSCIEISRELRLPCTCTLGPIETALEGNPSISVDCDGVVFHGDFPAIPYGAPIVSFSQKRAGYQTLPIQALTSYGLPLRSVDFSGNSLRRLTERVLQGLRASLVELRLSDNLLGDTLNPIFSTSEFRGLGHLQLLDLAGNGIKAVEEGMLEGCDGLQELVLDRNSFESVPSASLKGPGALKALSLEGNRIGAVRAGTFRDLRALERINLNGNRVGLIEGGAFEGLAKLKFLYLARNKLAKFNSDVFQGADNLQKLDLSENFIAEFPGVALKAFKGLMYLNLSANLIQNLDNSDLADLTNLYHLDLSRNNIANIVPGSFLGLRQLRRLDLSVNSLRTIEDDAFEGLDNLETLVLKDNNVLLIPASALGRLPKLSSLQLGYNRVAALSGDILRSVADHVTTLVISRNVVRELPAGTFQYFRRLQHLDLSGNLLTSMNSETFDGLQTTLLSLKVSQNRINAMGEEPLDFANLRALDVSANQLNRLPRDGFELVPMLEVLNVSRNLHLSSLPGEVFHNLPNLRVIDASRCNLRSIPADLFSRTFSVVEVDLSYNALVEVAEGCFRNMKNLTSVNLSNNRLTNIRSAAFVNVMNIKKLLLKGNQLSSFKGEHFNTGTSLEILDLSENQISYLFPSSFRIHPRIKEIYLARNKLNFFPADLISGLQFLELIDLSYNELKSVDELDFTRLPKLRSLSLANNQINSISEMAFHNSTQLQILDLSGNKLDRLGERTFEGLVRLELLNLEHNLLTELPDTVFERARLHMLENINLAHNSFELAPLKALQRQYFFISSVDLSHNKIKEIPADDSVMVNIKKLDLSFNPLSNETIKNILSEPKTVRELNVANTGITSIARLETPFLKALNLSHNNISDLSESSFERTTLLQTLDLSHNNISEQRTSLSKLWSFVRNLRVLNISFNPIGAVLQEDFEGLRSLEHLSLHDLPECGRIEKGAFKDLPNLSRLEAFGYPKLGYLDVQGLLRNVPYLEGLDVETKDAAIGGDQLQPVLHPRLRLLGVHGSRVRSVSSGTLSGLKAPCLTVRLQNTSLTSLPPALFFAIPRSSKVLLDVTGSQLTSLSPQMLTAIEDRKGDLRVVGLETNAIACDCGARALKKWLEVVDVAPPLRCASPLHLIGRPLRDLEDDDLTCEARSAATRPSTLASSPRTTRLAATRTTEPEIIWSLPATEKPKPKGPAQSSANDDTLIIGIVGGVVAFIAILVIVICIVRLWMTGNQYRGGGAVPVAAGSNCAWSAKGGAALCALPPGGYAGCSATLPHKVPGGGQAGRNIYSTVARTPYGQVAAQPYFIAYSADEKMYR